MKDLFASLANLGFLDLEKVEGFFVLAERTRVCLSHALAALAEVLLRELDDFGDLWFQGSIVDFEEVLNAEEVFSQNEVEIALEQDFDEVTVAN